MKTDPGSAREKPAGSRGLLLDTHAFFWMVQGEARLSRKVVPALLDQAADARHLYLSAISIWELAMLESKGRIALGRACQEWVDVALIASRVRIVPLEPEISVLSTRLESFPHSDPADRVIAATGILMRLSLITADKALLRYLGEQGNSVLPL